MNLEPLLATILSALLLGEVITPVQGLGAAIMLACAGRIPVMALTV